MIRVLRLALEVPDGMSVREAKEYVQNAVNAWKDPSGRVINLTWSQITQMRK